jgi:ATP-dependent DNA helicase RecQ
VTTSTTPSAVDPRDALQRLFRFPDFRPGQRPVIDAVLAGADLLAVMPTGAGKSLCYQLPAFLLPGCTVVISPLVALMKDQLDSLPERLRGQAAVFNSTIEREAMDARLEDLTAGRLKLVYVAPERLRQRPFVHALARAAISRFVVDEAHCISLWGHDFRPDYLFIPAVLDLLGGPPLLAMTATATPAVQAELQERFHRPLRRICTGTLRDNLFLEVRHVANRDEKYEALLDICKHERGAGIVYVSSRDNAEAIARFLRQNSVSARHYHAGLESAERAAVQDSFMSGRTRVIVATVAFGMGVDKPDVRFIVHFNASRSLEAYAQESGRAGRDGAPARCVLLWAASDKAALGRWAREDMLTRDVLQAVYRALRRGSRDRFSRWPLDRLTAAAADAGAGGIDDTTVRVAIGALEQVGVLRRHCDLPDMAQIRLLDTGGPAAALAEAIGAGVPGRYARDPLDLAEQRDVPPTEIEEELLRLQDAGVLAYQGVARGLLIELLPHPSDLAERLQALLDSYERGQKARVDEIDGYANTRRCRSATIARHFGADHPPRCDHCDVCLGAVAARSPAQPRSTRAHNEPERAPEDLILECVANLPFPMGRTGIGKVLKGSITSPVQEDRSRHFGALASLSGSAIEKEIDRLIDAGYLAVRLVGPDPIKDRRIVVTPEGFAKPPAPWPPPRPRSPRAQAPSAPSRPRPPKDGTAARSDSPDAPAVHEDEALIDERFEALRQWRRQRSLESGLPAYTVLNDETLRLLAARRITSLDDLSRVKGIGPAKLEQYGAPLLDLIGEAP